MKEFILGMLVMYLIEMILIIAIDNDFLSEESMKVFFFFPYALINTLVYRNEYFKKLKLAEKVITSPKYQKSRYLYGYTEPKSMASCMSYDSIKNLYELYKEDKGEE